MLIITVASTNRLYNNDMQFQQKYEYKSGLNNKVIARSSKVSTVEDE